MLSLRRIQISGKALCVGRGVLVSESLFDRFAEKLKSAAGRLRIGDPLDAGNFTGPVIHQDALEKVLGYNDLRARKAEQCYSRADA